MARPASKTAGKKSPKARRDAPTTKAKAKAKAKPASKAKAKSKAKSPLAFRPRAQYAALPFRTEPSLEILLVTSRETGRWIIPKGWPIRGKSRRATAAAEARQEAGVLGEIGRIPLGAYDYVKVLKTGLGIPCRVTVFPLLVTGHKARFREQDQRIQRWFDPPTAAASVQEPELARIILSFAETATIASEAAAGEAPAPQAG